MGKFIGLVTFLLVGQPEGPTDQGQEVTVDSRRRNYKSIIPWLGLME